MLLILIFIVNLALKINTDEKFINEEGVYEGCENTETWV